tara:strand:+ start:3154 stop:3405 length:252 start_codon:yes stop_codon:yes gene_type:complete
MKSIITILGLCVVLTGCSATTSSNVSNEWWNTPLLKKGDTPYDPPDGDWIFIPNEIMAGTKQSKRLQNWSWETLAENGKPPVY